VFGVQAAFYLLRRQRLRRSVFCVLRQIGGGFGRDKFGNFVIGNAGLVKRVFADNALYLGAACGTGNDNTAGARFFAPRKQEYAALVVFVQKLSVSGQMLFHLFERGGVGQGDDEHGGVFVLRVQAA